MCGLRPGGPPAGACSCPPPTPATRSADMDGDGRPWSCWCSAATRQRVRRHPGRLLRLGRRSSLQLTLHAPGSPPPRRSCSGSRPGTLEGGRAGPVRHRPRHRGGGDLPGGDGHPDLPGAGSDQHRPEQLHRRVHPDLPLPEPPAHRRQRRRRHGGAPARRAFPAQPPRTTPTGRSTGAATPPTGHAPPTRPSPTTTRRTAGT